MLTTIKTKSKRKGKIRKKKSILTTFKGKSVLIKTKAKGKGTNPKIKKFKSRKINKKQAARKISKVYGKSRHTKGGSLKKKILKRKRK